MPRWIYRLMFVSLALGIVLRCLWTSDMEYKFDEQYMFERSQAVGITESWPWLGMPSGAGTRNPGLSIWIFVWLARLFGIATPVGLAQAVILLNCLALLGLAYLTLRHVKEADREPWAWATIFASLNPIALQLQRKIWAQSVLPLFCVLFLIGWMKRDKKWGALVWGFLGAIIGQIHMSGFFFAAGFFIWTYFKERIKTEAVQWRAWFAGSFLGSLTLIPWIKYVLAGTDPGKHARLIDLIHFTYWYQWIAQSMGLSLSESLGHYPFYDFLRWPRVGGIPTFAMGLAHLAAIISGLIAVGFGVRALWRERANWRHRLIGRDSDSATAQNAAFWGHGGLMMLGRISVFRHYLIVAFPLNHLWMGRMALSEPRTGRRLLTVLAIAQLVISLGFLGYIHTHGGSPDGDYGVAYSAQVRH